MPPALRDTPAPTHPLRAGSKVLILTALFGAQVLAIILAFDSSLISSHASWAFVPRNAGEVFKVLTYYCVAVPIIVGPRLAAHRQEFLDAAIARPGAAALIAQFCAYGGAFILTWILFERSDALGDWAWPVSAAWIVAVALTGVLWLRCLAPGTYWINLLRRERLALGLAAVFAILVRGIQYMAMQSWLPLSAATLHFSRALLGVFYQDAFTDLAVMRLGTPGFTIRIAPECSGYEGIALVVVFLAWYVWVFRRELHFPRALALFPIAVALSWGLNVLRIVALVAVGSSLSPTIARRGFHSWAGWICFTVAAVVVVGLAHGSAFARKTAPAGSRLTLDAESAELIPLLVLLSATLLSSAFSAGFEWLYPLRVVATGLALACCWKQLGLARFRPTGASALCGGLVFLIWLALVPASAQKTAEFTAGLAGAAPLTAAAWLVVRCLGAVLTVPLAEELAFRGYLIAKLSGGNFDPGARLPFRWPAFAVSSILFGALHGAWLAGTLAGMCYAWARYRGGTVADAIAAHAITNLLLSIYVLGAGQWSYW